MSNNKILHIITSSGVGGAEKHLLRLLSCENVSGVEVRVISLSKTGFLNQELERRQIKNISINLKNPIYFLFSPVTFLYQLYHFRPNFIYSWMYHANLFSVFAVFYFFKYELFWNVRCSLDDLEKWSKPLRVVLRLSSYFSKFPDIIVFNSQLALLQHQAYGFLGRESAVIYNLVAPQSAKNRQKNLSRAELNIPENVFLLGSFGRNIPAKRMFDLLCVTRKLIDSGIPSFSIFVGRGFDNEEFASRILELKLSDHVLTVPETPDLYRYYCLLDAFVLPSEAEGFPNVVAEAALHSVPVICSRVSDIDLFLPYSWQIFDVGDTEAIYHSAKRLRALSNVEVQKLSALQYDKFNYHTNSTKVCDDFFSFCQQSKKNPLEIQ